MDKTDRRILRSRALITDALLSLLMEKDYHEITIREITDYANVGRATFYLHYSSKDDCLMQLLTQGFDSLVAELVKPIQENNVDFVTNIESIFKHTTQNRKLYLALLGEQQTTQLLTNIQDYITENVLKKAPFPQGIDPVIKKATAVFLAGALQNLLVWWLREQPPITTREAAELYIRFTTAGCFDRGNR